MLKPKEFDANALPNMFILFYLINETINRIASVDLQEEDQYEVVMNQLTNVDGGKQ